MKKAILLFLGTVYFGLSEAAIKNITVVDYQFSPSTLNATVGDIIQFNFAQTSNAHNATSEGDLIPVGAAQINSGSVSKVQRTYQYTITVAGTYQYYCVAHGGPNLDGMSGKIVASPSLPVTLKDFSIATSADKKPALIWKTLTEQNVNYFSVRSSTDGLHFSEIAKITAAGNSVTEQSYTYTDHNVSTKYRYVYYELGIIDRNGKESLSTIKMYKNTVAVPKLIMQLGPNPIKRPGQLMMQFNSEKEGFMEVTVFDAVGKLVIKTKMQAMPGLNNAHLHVCDFSPGTYSVQFSLDGIRETKRVVVN